jgi:hypothetical protein
MESTSLLDQLRIASPCSVPWDSMKGDDRVRYCATCEKHVYNIITLSSDEAADLIRRTEGKVCVQLHRRRDGTILTADCPVGSRLAAGRRLRRLTAVAAALTGLWAIDSLLAITERLPYVQISAPRQQVQALRAKLAAVLYRNPARGEVVVGEMVPVTTGTPGPIVLPPAATTCPMPPAR